MSDPRAIEQVKEMIRSTHARQHRKRGQTIGQVFLFILGGLVFVMILLYGYRGVQKIMKATETTTLNDIESDLRNKVESIRLDYGSMKRLELKVPTKYREICFITDARGAEAEMTAQKTIGLPGRRLLIESAEGGAANVFLNPMAEKSFDIDGIEIEGGAKCHCSKNAGGKVVLRLESVGNGVKISDWNTGVTC